MKVSAIIFGASGMVGKGVLLECLDSNDVEKVLIIGRRPAGIEHPKLKEIITPEIDNVAAYEQELKNYNACYFCAGISAVGLSEEKYRAITYTLTIKIASQLYTFNPDMVFCYVSGKGTDINSSMMWSKVKAETEDAISNMGFRSAYMFRPGLIIPLKGIRSRTTIYNLAYLLLKPFIFLMRKSPSLTDTTRVGKAMINAAKVGYENKNLENRQINILSER